MDEGTIERVNGDIKMASLERSKKRIQLWKKALVHFALCFVTGFFIGFAPTSTASIFSASLSGAGARLLSPDRSNNVLSLESSDERRVVNRSLTAEFTPPPPLQTEEEENDNGELVEKEDGVAASAPGPRNTLIVVTTTRSGDGLEGASLRRLAYTLRLVPPPMLWLVVQARAEARATAQMLRTTGVMYRHLTFRENFTDPAAEADHQRNLALEHVERHRLSGIVHFAGASNVYDLRLFEEMRQIEIFGTWPVAMVSTNKKRVVLDGPVCRSSKIVGWFLVDLSDDTASARNLMHNGAINMKPSKINISGFAFNSSILWNPERWDRSTLLPDISQNSIRFVQEVVLEDETKIKGIPADCSRIMLWHLYMPRVHPLHQSQNQTAGKMQKENMIYNEGVM